MADKIKTAQRYFGGEDANKDSSAVENSEYMEWKRKCDTSLEKARGRDAYKKALIKRIEQNNFINFEHFLRSLSPETKRNMESYGLMDDADLVNEIERKKAFRLERYNSGAATGSREEQSTFIKLNLPTEDLTKIQTGYKNEEKKAPPKIEITFAESRTENE